MTREEAINALVLERLHRIVERRQTQWLQNTLENGFAGYASLSDEELERELTRLGLEHEQEAETDDLLDDDPDPADDDWDDEPELSSLSHSQRDAESFDLG